MPAYAQDEPAQQPEPDSAVFPETSEQDKPAEDAQKSVFSFLDWPQKTVSIGFKKFVMGTDEFFANEKVFYETSGSYLRLTGEALYTEGGNQGYYSDLKIKLKLPVTEKKMSLLVESNPGEDDEEIDKALEPTPTEAVQQKEYFAGVQTTIGDETSWKLKPSVGIKLHSPIDYYTRFRLTREVGIGNGSFLFTEALYWFNSTGWESDTSGEFNIKVLDSLLFRSSTGANWQEETEDIKLRQIFSLTHYLSERRAISYQLRFDGIDEPTIHTTQYSVLAHYRQNLHAGYLFMDLIPKVTYLEETDFRADYSLTVRLEMVFNG